LGLAFKSIVNDPRRSMLYVLTLALLLMVICAPIAIANAYSSQLLEAIPKLASNRLLILNGSACSLSSAPLEYSIVDALRGIGLRKILPQLLVYSTIPGHGDGSAPIRGIEGIEDFYRDRGVKLNGSIPKADLEANVGILLARRIGVGVGDSMQIVLKGERWSLRIVGIVDCECPSDDEILVGLPTLWKMDGDLAGRISLVEVISEGVGDMQRIEEELLTRFDGVAILLERPFNEAATMGVNMTFQSIRGWVAPIYASIALAAYMITWRLTVDSEREVVVLRSIGASKRCALAYLLSKSLLIIVLAAIVGIALGVVSAQLIFRAVSLLLSTGFYQPPSLTPLDLVQTAALFLLSAAAGSLYPSLRMSSRGVEVLWRHMRP